MTDFKCDCIAQDATECRRLRHGIPVSFRNGQDDEWEYFKCGCGCHRLVPDLPQEERAKIEHDAEQKLRKWYQLLSAEEADAWAEASMEDLKGKEADVGEQLAGTNAFLWLARDCGPSDDPWAAIAAVRRKENKTLTEAEALDAWDRIQRNPFTK